MTPTLPSGSPRSLRAQPDQIGAASQRYGHPSRNRRDPSRRTSTDGPSRIGGADIGTAEELLAVLSPARQSATPPLFELLDTPFDLSDLTKEMTKT